MPHIAESHPEPEERKTMPKFDEKAEAPVYELLEGDYPFEIAGVENKISKGPKTAGREVRDLSLDFYADETFTTKLATVKDSLIDHESCDWKFSVLAKCVHYPVKHGEAFDIDGCWRGYRGWAHLSPEPDKQDPKKKWNRVRIYITDRAKIPARVIDVESEDEIPF